MNRKVWKQPLTVVQKFMPRLPDNIHCTTNLDQDSWETAKS